MASYTIPHCSWRHTKIAWGPGVVFVLMLALTTGCRHQAPALTKLQKGQIQDLVKTEIENGSFPGAVVLIGQEKTVLFEAAFGDQAIEPNRQPMHMDTVFDLASLTKPLATAASVMVLMDQSKICLLYTSPSPRDRS